MVRVEALDGLSPVEVFLAWRRMAYPFILSGGVSRGMRRFSVVGAEPSFVVKVGADGTVTLEGKKTFTQGKDPFSVISDILSTFRDCKRGPFPFNSGGVGYFAYDLKDLIEKPVRKNFHPRDGIGLPLCMVGFYGTVFVFDHLEKRAYLVQDDLLSERGIHRELAGTLMEGKGVLPPGIEVHAEGIVSSMTMEGFVEGIRRAQGYIESGDIYQINLSQRFSIQWSGDPLGLYLHLLRNNPAPFCSYLEYDGFKIISNSPERLLMVRGTTAETSPIKGTRPRGRTPLEDRTLVEELKKDVKERAEHVMIVDLERNDLGRVSVPGTVRVEEFGSIETLPGLHHMVSRISGRLRDGIDSMMCLRALFPGGSVTGAPKIRAMEIIDEIEPTRREIYTGGMGWIDLSGDTDISMAIRTAVYVDGTIYLHVGSGIVWDSVPEREYHETILKAHSFLHALGCDDRLITDRDDEEGYGLHKQKVRSF